MAVKPESGKPVAEGSKLKPQGGWSNKIPMLQGHKPLKVDQRAYKLVVTISSQSNTFPKEERYSPTTQIRRSSRSPQRLAANNAEGFREGRHPNTSPVSWLTPTPRRPNMGLVRPRLWLAGASRAIGCRTQRVRESVAWHEARCGEIYAVVVSLPAFCFLAVRPHKGLSRLARWFD